MKLNIGFTQEDAELICDGYYEMHKKHIDILTDEIPYQKIHEYIRLGKKVRIKKRLRNFFESWGGVLMWIIVVALIFCWNAYKNNKDEYKIKNSSSSSGIYYSDTCAITTCNDGSCSSSTGRGTCSHHGGVRN